MSSNFSKSALLPPYTTSLSLPYTILSLTLYPSPSHFDTFTLVLPCLIITPYTPHSGRIYALVLLLFISFLYISFSYVHIHVPDTIGIRRLLILMHMRA